MNSNRWLPRPGYHGNWPYLFTLLAIPVLFTGNPRLTLIGLRLPVTRLFSIVFAIIFFQCVYSSISLANKKRLFL